MQRVTFDELHFFAYQEFIRLKLNPFNYQLNKKSKRNFLIIVGGFVFLRTLILEVLLDEELMKNKITQSQLRKQNFQFPNKNSAANRLQNPELLSPVSSEEVHGEDEEAHRTTRLVLPRGIQPECQRGKSRRLEDLDSGHQVL